MKAPAFHPARALALAVAVVALVGLATRIWIAERLPLNGDEALTGLMANNLLRAEPSWVLAGNHYGGTAETFLAAPLLAVFPASGAALRGVSIALWALAAVLLGLSARRLVSTPLAVLAAGMYWLLSWSSISLSIRAFSGYAAGAAAFAGWLLLQIGDGMHGQPDSEPHATKSRILIRRILLGGLAGFAVWQHPLFLAPLVPGILVAAAAHRRELLRWGGAVGLGILLGMSPFLYYNIVHSWPSFAEPPTPSSWSYAFRLGNIVSTGFPRVLGLRLGDSTFRIGEAEWVGGAWGSALALAIGLLVAYAFVLACRRPGAAWLIGITGLVSPFLLALFRNSIRNVDGRHAALFYPVLALLALSVAVQDRFPSWRPRPLLVAVLPLVFGLVSALPGLLLETRREHAIARLPQVISTLDAAGVRFVRADHWMAYPLTFATGERIKAADFNPVRFPHLDAAVTSAGSEIAYIFLGDSSERLELRDSLAADPRFRRRSIGVWTIFLPTRPAQ